MATKSELITEFNDYAGAIRDTFDKVRQALEDDDLDLAARLMGMVTQTQAQTTTRLRNAVERKRVRS